MECILCVAFEDDWWYIFYKNSRFGQGFLTEQAAKESHYYKYFKELIG